MIPCTSITAILSMASLSSVITSSSLGPTARMCFPLEETRLPIIPVRLTNRLSTRKSASIIAKTIQPRPRPGCGEEGATITGGGGFSGGGGGGGGADAGGGGGDGGA